MTENEISKAIVDTALSIHKTIGPGMLEHVYETIMEYELRKKGLIVDRQKDIPVKYNNVLIESAFRADLIVNDIVLIELKSIEQLAPVHFKQVLTYLKLGNFKLGLLINFNETMLKNGIKRIVNNLDE